MSGKPSNRASNRASKNIIKHKKTSALHRQSEEGLLSVQFSFDGKKYSRRHQLTIMEVQHMKQTLEEFGDAAREQLIWQMAVKFCGQFAENVLAQAALEYIKQYHKPKEPVVVESTVFDPPPPKQLTMDEGLKELSESLQFQRDTGL